MQARPDDLPTDRASKTGGGHHQPVVIFGVNPTAWRRWTLPTLHVDTLRCGLHLETKGAEHVHRALDPVGFLVGGMGSPVQSSARPKRKKSSKRREEIVGVAQVDLLRGFCGRAGRQSALVGPSDAQRVSQVGKEVATKCVLRAWPSVELHHALRAADPQERKGRHGGIPRQVNRVRRLNVPDGEMHACVAQFTRPSARLGDVRRERKMQGTARLALKTNLAVHGLKRTGEKQC